MLVSFSELDNLAPLVCFDSVLSYLVGQRIQQQRTAGPPPKLVEKVLVWSVWHDNKWSYHIHTTKNSTQAIS